MSWASRSRGGPATSGSRLSRLPYWRHRPLSLTQSATSTSVLLYSSSRSGSPSPKSPSGLWLVSHLAYFLPLKEEYIISPCPSPPLSPREHHLIRPTPRDPQGMEPQPREPQLMWPRSREPQPKGPQPIDPKSMGPQSKDIFLFDSLGIDFSEALFKIYPSHRLSSQKNLP